MTSPLVQNITVTIKTSITTTKFKGNTVHLNGHFISEGAVAPQVSLVKSDLTTFSLDECKGKYVVMNIFPSIDTGICATSVRKFNQLAASLPNTVVLCISRDLPFAQNRFCGAEGIENVVTASNFRPDCTFGTDYGVQMSDGPLAGLLARSVVVVTPRWYGVPRPIGTRDYHRTRLRSRHQGHTVEHNLQHIS